MTHRTLSRRTILRGLGTAVALPFLDAMYPAFASQAAKASLRPTRMAFLYVPNGIVMADWTPAGEIGATPLASLPRISSILDPYKSDLTFLTGLTSNGGRALGDGPGDRVIIRHAEYNTPFAIEQTHRAISCELWLVETRTSG